MCHNEVCVVRIHPEYRLIHRHEHIDIEAVQKGIFVEEGVCIIGSYQVVDLQISQC